MKKNIILLLISISIIGACSYFDGNLSGVITYYFNENYGDKADVGAKIYILKTSDFNKDSAKIISRFTMQKRSYSYAKQRIELDELVEKIDIDSKHKEWDKLLSNFDIIAEKVYPVILNFQYNKNVKEIVADGNGSYNTKLSFGEYYVLVISNHREGDNIVEYHGLIDFNSIKIKPRKEITLNVKFDIE